MTSRYRNVLVSTGVQKYFGVQVLQHEEAWILFQKKFGGIITDSNLQPIAIEIAHRCAGLPGLITAVAKALRHQDLREWRDSLERLKRFDHEEIEEQVNSALELSYSFLKAEAKLLFLLCGQNGPHDIDIKYLLKYALGLGILEFCSTIEATRNRLHSLVKDLKASSLLLEAGNKDGVLHMHDLVYNFAISAASKDAPVITSSRMMDFPEKDIFENCVAMVLNKGGIPQCSGVLNCPKLRFFLLNNGDLSLEMGDNFFGGMKELRVLNMKNAAFISLPLSLQFLEELQTLCLDSCELEDVTRIGKLTKLQVLSLVNCTIAFLPSEISNLTDLKLLDLKDCPSLKTIEPNVLSSLTQLEELYMENSFVNWKDSEAHDGKHENASLTELEHLSKLVTLNMHIMDAKMLPKDLPVKQLEDFKILIGEAWDWNVEYKASRTLKLKLNTSNHLERVKGLLMRTEDLYLDDLNGVENVLDSLDGEGFPQLKHLLVQNNLHIQYIIDWRRMGHLTAFPNLESLSLNNLNKLETICSAPLRMSFFGSLRRLKVGNCSLLKNLFSFSIFRSLEKLEEIDVSSCKVIEMIVVYDDDSGEDEAIKVEQLQTLALDHLPQFANFCSQVQRMQMPIVSSGEIISEQELQTSLALFNGKIEFPNLINLMLLSTSVKNIWSDQLRDVSPCTKSLTTLIVDGCWNLGYIFTSSMVQNLAQLEKLEITNCSSLTEVIATQGLEEGMMMTRTILFPKLYLLKLKNLPKLERFCSGDLIECPLLNVLRVESCPYLQTFVFSPMQIDAGATSLFDEKVSFPKLEELYIVHMHRLVMIWKHELQAAGSFEKLKVLKVIHAKELLQLFPSNMLISVFRNLETLVVRNCDLIKQVFDMEGVMQVKERLVLSLRSLDMRNLPMLKRVWNREAYEMENLGWNNLRIVIGLNCPSLKSFFPASIAIDLLQLEELYLDECAMEEVIIEGLQTSPTFCFPKLKCIQLYRLYELRTFYPRAHTFECRLLETLWVYSCEKLELFALQSPNSKTEIQPLFSFSQVMPNLKKMTLRYKDAMGIEQGHIPTHLFHRLEEVELDCFNDTLSYPPFDLLQRFQNMQKLFLLCSDSEELFPSGLAGDDQNVGTITRIQYLSLNALASLRRIWNQESQHKQALQNLDTLRVTRCHELISLVPSFASFQSLQSLNVQECDGLMNLFETTATKSLVNLKTMIVKECNMVTEIVATEGDGIQTEVTLMKLECLELHCLKSLVCFSFANCQMKFPSLIEVIVTQCPKMKFFSQGNVYSPKLKKVCVTEDSDKWRWVGDLNATVEQLYVEMAGFENMQHVKLSEFPQLQEKWLVQLPVELFYKLTSLVVDDCAFQSIATPYNLLPFLIALEKLEIRNCHLLEGLFDLEQTNAGFGYLSNLKEFQLIDLPLLRHVWDDIPKDMLNVKNLTSLKFHNCNSLRNILTPKMCLGLVQLKNLQVTSCQMVEEIIAPPASKDRTTPHTIVFPLLECIFFEDLPNLTGFYCAVECPCLTEITIAGCPQLNITDTTTELKVVSSSHLTDLKKQQSIDIHEMWNCQSLTSLRIDGFANLKFLFSSSVAKSLVNLKKVEISNCGMLEQVIYMEVHEEQMIRLLNIHFLKLKDLPKLTQFSLCNMLDFPSLKELQIQNCPILRTFVSDSTSSKGVPNSELQITSALFDEKVAFPNLEILQLVKMENLRMIWSNRLHSDSFEKLEVLKVEDGKQLMEIFPHNILARLKNLKDLVIESCDSVEEVFDIHRLLINAKEMERVTSRLIKIDIQNMLNLKCVWNEDPKSVVSFHKLTSMYVLNCPNIKSLFPISIAKSLEQLETLDLNVSGVVELVAEAEEGVVEEAPEFVFPRLKYLDLWKLQNLECFFRGIHILDCPVLERLCVYRCDKLEVFTPETQMDKSLFSISKIISNLNHLSLTSKDAAMIKESQFSPQLFHKLKTVELNFFDGESEASPSDLLKLFHNVERLYVRWCAFKELFPHEGLDKARVTLKLLKISGCHNLISLAPYSVSFQNLTDLDLDNCYGLVSLMGLSTARSLVQLEKMSVTNCNNLSEIVSNEGSNEEIVFYKLHRLELNNLARLVSFCSAKCSFRFPSLTQVIVSHCPNIKFFSEGVSVTPKLKMVQLLEAEKGHWNDNLNAIVHQLYSDSSK